MPDTTTWELVCRAIEQATHVRPNPYASCSAQGDLLETLRALAFELAPKPDESGRYERHHISMSFGELPSRAAFDAVFNEVCPDGRFAFGNDERVGYADLTDDELWDEIEKAMREHDLGEGEKADAAESWVSCVLSVLGFEWV